jgi:hypothetical protein
MAKRRSGVANHSSPPTSLHSSKRSQRKDEQIELQRTQSSIPTESQAAEANGDPPAATPAPSSPVATDAKQAQISGGWCPLLGKIGRWLGVGIGFGALVVAVYYGYWSYRMQKWQAEKEFQEWCSASALRVSELKKTNLFDSL